MEGLRAQLIEFARKLHLYSFRSDYSPYEKSIHYEIEDVKDAVKGDIGGMLLEALGERVPTYDEYRKSNLW